MGLRSDPRLQMGGGDVKMIGALALWLAQPLRAPKRAEIGLPEGRAVPFFGVDIWNAYELSWLNPKGKPQVALASFIIPADTPNIIESKSFKL